MTFSNHKNMHTWLFIAGDDLDAIEQAAQASPSVLVIDLEEFTAKENKALACQRLPQAIAICQQHNVECAIRIDALLNGGTEQLEWLADSKPYAVFLPQVERPEQLLRLTEQMSQFGLADTPIVPTIESYEGVNNFETIASCSANIIAALLGTGDLSKSMGLSEEPLKMEIMKPQRVAFLATCLQHSIIAIDGPWPDLRDEPNNKINQENDLSFAYQSGFRSKCIIDKKQIPKKL
ncbi:aldolase/citrate lyase family protein [Marinomonas pollencensis]|uniref:Citrate lyase beta subunit n=1 Tax=Marinomonas pollencensis TaxID=491954 RepID=A0A3E0DN10_9GAMM|nr:aldolase/citrate lyase family protein [Marinomonas pollencensis]REG83191.1 citrate lyase beta subunit [Marinomonas pollencensis]